MQTMQDPGYKALRESLRNPAVPQRKDSCLHGAVKPNAGVLSGIIRYQGAFNGRVRVLSDELPLAVAHVRGSPRDPWTDIRGALLSQATDAVLAADFPNSRSFIRQALYIDAAHSGAAGAVAVSETIARTHESVVEMRAFLAVQTGCGCLGSRYVRQCALPGCGATHEVGGAVLKCCQRCLVTWYCGKEHQTAHWGAHKKGCKAEAAKQQAAAGAAASAGGGGGGGRRV